MNIPEFNDIIETNDQTEARNEHLEKLREIVGNVYPNKYRREVLQDGQEIIPDQKATIKTVVEFARPIKEKNIPELADGEKPSDEQREAANAELNSYRVRVAGRIAVPPRVMGKAAFVHLSDGVERLQIYVRKQDARAINNNTGEAIDDEDAAWELFGLLDHGDFIGVEGYLFVTKTGELSVHVETIQFLSKARLPMPDKIHGIADPELRRRYRYADLIADSLKIEHEENELTTREVFERRAKLISGMRNYLDEHGFIEVETPMLTPKATGAAAKPFSTHHNALDLTLYARIAPELYLKRLTVGGFEKVYELNRNFRNEGLSHKHNPEFTMLEFYCAYMDVNGMMDFCEEMLKDSVRKANNGSLQVNTQQMKGSILLINTPYRGSRSNPKQEGEIVKPDYINVYNTKIDFSVFTRLTMTQAIARESNFVKFLINEDIDKWIVNGANSKILRDLLWWFENDFTDETTYISGDGEIVEKLSKEETDILVNNIWKEINEKYENLKLTDVEIAKEILAIFEEFVEENLIQPTFITDYPKIISPLSKASPENPQIAERFELFINGMECANGFSELNDPHEQYERFRDQMRERETGDEEAMIMDEDYIRALSYGMPPAAGIGIGIDRLVMLLTNRHSIRDVILFPHMRPVTREEEKMSEGEEEKEN